MGPATAEAVLALTETRDVLQERKSLRDTIKMLFRDGILPLLSSLARCAVVAFFIAPLLMHLPSEDDWYSVEAERTRFMVIHYKNQLTWRSLVPESGPNHV